MFLFLSSPLLIENSNYPLLSTWNYHNIVNWLSVSSVQFSRSIVSDSLRPHEWQHARPPCSSPTPGIHSDSRPPSQWCHAAISSSVVPFSSCPQSLPALESFPVSQLFAWCGQSTGVSALASFLPKNTQDWYNIKFNFKKDGKKRTRETESTNNRIPWWSSG